MVHFVSSSVLIRSNRRVLLQSGILLGFSFGSLLQAFAQQTYETPGEQVPALELVHYTDAYPWSPATARVLAASFAELSIEVNTKPLDLNVFVGTILLNRELNEMAVGFIAGSPDHYSPTYYLNAVNGSGSFLNPTLYSNEEFDRIAAEQAGVMDPAKRAELVAQAQQIHARDLPSWFLSMRGTHFVYNKERWPDLKPIEPFGFLIGLNQLLDATPADPGHTTFIQAWSADAASWNLFAEGAPGYQARHRWVYDTFTRFSYDGELVPWAAESWEWVDSTHIKVKLRSGMTFHDGKPVTVDDAVFSFNYWIKYKPPFWTSVTSNQKAATKIDDSTFQVELFKPDADFAAVSLSTCVILPKHIWENVPEKVGVTNPWDWDPVAANQVIGSGPFEFVSWRREQETNFKANKSHFHSPKMDAMRIVQFSSADAMAAALETGQVDWGGAPLPGNAQKSLDERTPALGFLNETGFNAAILWMNQTKAPYNDPAFRQALHLATHYKRIRDVAFLGLSALPGAGPIPNYLPWYDKTLDVPEYNLEKAKQVLKDAGYVVKDGRLHYPG